MPKDREPQCILGNGDCPPDCLLNKFSTSITEKLGDDFDPEESRRNIVFADAYNKNINVLDIQHVMSRCTLENEKRSLINHDAENNKKYSVEPGQIDASKHLSDSFKHNQTEVSAGYIIRMLQEREKWEAFTKEEIEEFYNRSGYTGFSFNALINPVNETLFDGRTYQVGGGYVVERDDGKYEVTEDFVDRAYKSSPRSTEDL